MIVNKAVYRDGERHECHDLSNELDALDDRTEGFLWIGLKDPSQEEFDQVKDQLRLHPLAVEDAVHADQRPKIEPYDTSIFVVLKTLRYIDETSDVETGDVMMFLGEHFVVTVRHGEGNPLAGVRQRLEQDSSRLQNGPIAVLHAVMDSVVDNYVRVDREIRKDLEQIEEQVFDEQRGGDVSTIYRLKREVLEFRRASQPLADTLVEFMERGRGRTMAPGVIPYFRDVGDHLRQVNDHIDSYDRLLSDVLSAHLASVSVKQAEIGVNQNADMRRISAWVAIAAVPTMIAGIYGMNFENMPELSMSLRIGDDEWQFGYFLVVTVMAGVCASLYRAFKRSGWL